MILRPIADSFAHASVPPSKGFHSRYWISQRQVSACPPWVVSRHSRTSAYGHEPSSADGQRPASLCHEAVVQNLIQRACARSRNQCSVGACLSTQARRLYALKRFRTLCVIWSTNSSLPRPMIHSLRANRKRTRGPEATRDSPYNRREKPLICAFVSCA